MSFLSIQKLKISQQVLYTSILIMTVSTILLIGYISVSSINSTNNQYQTLAEANASSVIDKIDRNFYERFGDVQAFAFNRLAIKTAASDTVSGDAQDFINTMVSYYVLYDLMMITDINGKVVATNTLDRNGKVINNRELVGRNFANEEWFRTCISGSGPEGGAWYSDFMVNPISAQLNGNNGQGMAFAAPIKAKNGEVVGVWYNFANWGEVTQGIRKETQKNLNKSVPGTFLLVTNEMNETIDSDMDKMMKSATKVSAAGFTTGAEFDFNGVKVNEEDFVLGTSTGKGAYTYKGKNWNVLTFVPKAKISWQYFVDKLLILIISVIAIVVFICYIFYLLARRISGNINLIKDNVVELSTGNLIEVVEMNSEDEIGDMSRSMKTLVRGLKEKSEFAQKIGQGDLLANYSVENESDVLGTSLLSMRENLVKVAEDDKKRNWTTEGLALFGEILRANNQEMSKLADDIISGLVKYLNANQGGLFVVNDTNPSDKYLELIACYAWNKKKYLHMRIEEGEGLVGQAWQENDTLYITDVPSDFVKITSGLGGATPNSFLIVPLTVNDETFGVIEIASFNLFEQYHIDFVNKLAESIASTLSTSKVNERTRILLEQSQQQTEEMRAQEEEMRQNMEEMAATQEEMERKELQMTEMVEKMKIQEETMRQNIEEMEATQEQMDYQSKIMAEKTELLEAQKLRDDETKKIYEGEINSMYEKWYNQLKRMEQFVKSKN
jgi:methyl-accepting chemotaxis protein